MNGHPFVPLPHIAAPVRKYQDRWQICLDRKTHTYYWLRGSAQQDLRGNQDGSVHFQENPSKGLNYDTQAHHTRRDNRPDAGIFQTGRGAAAVYRHLHRRPILRSESLFAARVPGPRQLGRYGWPNVSRDLYQPLEHYTDSGRVIAWNRQHRG